MKRRVFLRARPALILAALLASSSAFAAERELEVLVVRFPEGAAEERYRYMDLPAAVRFLSPVAFSAKGGVLSFESDSSAGYLERGREPVANRPGGNLERVSVLLAAAAKEPRPSRTVTVAFTLDELLARGGSWSGVPAAWACARAASDTRWSSGRVWARSVAYDARAGRITVRVALLK